VKTHRLYVLAVCVLAVSQAVHSQASPEVDLDRPLARVGDEIITVGEFAREVQIRLRDIQATTGRTVKPDLRFRRAMMNELVNGRVLSVAARNAGVKISDEELQKEFEERKAALGDEAAYAAYLERMKLTEDALRENIRSRMRVTRYVDETAGELTATEEEIQEAYESLKARGAMTRPEKTRDIAAILFRPAGESDEDWQAAEARAIKAHERLVAGEDFKELAKELSDEPNTAKRGGVLREMKFGTFHPELEEAMDTLETGAFSNPVRSTVGWYLVEILQINEPGTIPLDSVREGVEQEVIDAKRKKVMAEIVADAQKLLRIELVPSPEMEDEDGGSGVETPSTEEP